MKYFDWSTEKSIYLASTRDISFEEVLLAISDNGLLDVIAHPNKQKYAHQKTYIVEINHYVYAVPCVENDEKIFFKTIYPSRKLTKHYLKGEQK